MSIGELASATGVKAVTIRYYEQIGVLPAPARTAGNYRSYSQGHSQRLRFIRRCRDLGFSLNQVHDFFRLSAEEASSSCIEVRRIAERHLQDIEEKLADLNEVASQLRQITSSCSGKNPMAECRIMDALSNS